MENTTSWFTCPAMIPSSLITLLQCFQTGCPKRYGNIQQKIFGSLTISRSYSAFLNCGNAGDVFQGFQIQTQLPIRSEVECGQAFHFTTISYDAPSCCKCLCCKTCDSCRTSRRRYHRRRLQFSVLPHYIPGEYIFTNPAQAGTLEFACHLPGHYEAGMKLAIVVK